MKSRLIIVLATELFVGVAALYDQVFVRHPENLINKLLSKGIEELSGLTALIVKSQNQIALPSFKLRANWKSNKTQHIYRITAELGH